MTTPISHILTKLNYALPNNDNPFSSTKDNLNSNVSYASSKKTYPNNPPPNSITKFHQENLQQNENEMSAKNLNAVNTQDVVSADLRGRINSRFADLMEKQTHTVAETDQNAYGFRSKSGMAKKSSKWPYQLQETKDNITNTGNQYAHTGNQKQAIQLNTQVEHKPQDIPQMPSNLFQNGNNSTNLPAIPSNNSKASLTIPFSTLEKLKEGVQTVIKKPNLLAPDSSQNSGGHPISVQNSGHSVVSSPLQMNQIKQSINSFPIANQQTVQYPANPISITNTSANVNAQKYSLLSQVPNNSTAVNVKNTANSTTPTNNIILNNLNNQANHTNASLPNNFFSSGKTNQQNTGQILSKVHNNVSLRTQTNNNATQLSNNIFNTFLKSNSQNIHNNTTNPFNNNSACDYNNTPSNPFATNQNFSCSNNNPSFNHPLNHPMSQSQTINNDREFLSYVAAEQRLRQQTFRNTQSDTRYQQFLQNLQKCDQFQDICLEDFVQQCFKNLNCIYQQLEYLSNRPFRLVEQFKQNKIVVENLSQLQKILKLEPNSILTKINLIQKRINDSFICAEKMQLKIEGELEHRLSAALKKFEQIQDEINQYKLEVPEESQNELIDIYNHLASIDLQLNQVNSIADYYINLLKTE